MTHTGSCHCGAVRFTAEIDPSTGMTCNCSHCSRKGFILSFIPAEKFTLEHGAENLTEYRFNTKKIAHLFCKTCGVESFGRGVSKDGSETVMVNLRCIEDLDPATIVTHPYNGKDRV